MTRSSRNPDAYDEIRDDALTEQEYVELHAAALAKCDRQAARIATLEAQLAAATEREREILTLIGDLEWVYDDEYGYWYCPECRAVRSVKHVKGCRIAAALAAAQPASDGQDGK